QISWSDGGQLARGVLVARDEGWLVVERGRCELEEAKGQVIESDGQFSVSRFLETDVVACDALAHEDKAVQVVHTSSLADLPNGIGRWVGGRPDASKAAR